MRNQKADRFVQVGLAHHQAGRLDQANTAYQEALSENPEHPDALHLLGMLAHQVGNHDLARDLINLALHANPHSPVFHCNLGTVAQSQGKLDEAVACFRKAIQINPANAVFHYNLGHALQKQGQLQDAVAAYRQALALAPNHIESLSNLGHCLLTLGEPGPALENFRLAANIAPGLPEMHFNLGTALGAQSRLDEAIASYRQAIALFPDYAQAHCNLGASLLAQGRHDEAIASYRRTLELQPDFAEGHCNLGNALRAQGRLDEATACYRAALAIRPGYANAYSNLLFLSAYHATLAAEEYLALARGWELACVTPDIRHAARQRTFSRAPLSGRRLKVGYVSGDFRKHAVSYFMEQLLAQHDHARVELYAYSNNRTRDEVTGRLHDLFDHWTPIWGMSDEDVCQRIAADGIDVLIDLSAHSAHNRLGVFAHRAAPVQATYLYFASTGLSEMDYWIGDAILAPPEMDGSFSETVWRLPRTWLSYQTIAEAPLPAWQPAADGSVCLGCFNNLGKLTPPTLRLWARIMQALPESRLLLKNKDLADAGNRRRILAELAAHGIGAERIELEPGSDWHDYMAQHDRVDIALDPIASHGGGTSTCDALWMGVPVIHLLGDHVGARFSASLLEGIGRGEWIAHSEAEYLDKTIALARDVALRKHLRSSQRERMAHSPLCNARDLAHTLEEAYSDMFGRWMASPSFIPTAD